MTDLLTLDEIRRGADNDIAGHRATDGQRERIRAIMNGGAQGVRALLGDDIDLGEDGTDLPAANLMLSGLERQAQRLGAVPMVKVDPIDDDDEPKEKARAAKQERIVETYDELSRIELHLPQQGRWVPGYGYGVWVIEERSIGQARYPVATLRDPFGCYPGHWGADQQPKTLTVVRQVPGATIRRLYPRVAGKFPDDGPGLHSSWEGHRGAYTIITYYHWSGDYTYCDETGVMLEAVPNPLGIGRFVVPHRPVFDQLVGQFEHVVGLMAMHARLNILAAVAMEDGVETETNVFGPMRSTKYRKGRDAVNEFASDARVEKPASALPYQLFEQVDRIERQARITAGYPVTADAESPNAFVTGRGLEELGAGADRITLEYQTIFRWALRDLDALRLRWDEVYYGEQLKPMWGVRGGVPFSEKYRPKVDIKGRHRTRRIYGVFAGMDETTKIVGGIQMVNNEIIDLETLQENITGIDNVPRVNMRIRRRKVEEGLLAGLNARHAQNDPAAQLALVDLYQAKDLTEWEQVMLKHLTPKEPQMSPEEMAFAQPPQPLDVPQTPPPVATVLSRLEQDGGVEAGGAQTVNVVGRR